MLPGKLHCFPLGGEGVPDHFRFRIFHGGDLGEQLHLRPHEPPAVSIILAEHRHIPNGSGRCHLAAQSAGQVHCLLKRHGVPGENQGPARHEGGVVRFNLHMPRHRCPAVRTAENILRLGMGGCIQRFLHLQHIGKIKFFPQQHLPFSFPHCPLQGKHLHILLNILIFCQIPDIGNSSGKRCFCRQQNHGPKQQPAVKCLGAHMLHLGSGPHSPCRS